MTKINTDINMQFLHQLARQLFFELDDEQCQNLILEFQAIAQQMTFVTKIDTKNIEPLDYPFAITKTYLRADKIEQPLAQAAVLAVAPQVSDDYIVINKVVGE